MKLVFNTIVSAMLCGVMFVSCGGDKNTPMDVADKIYKAALKKDYVAYAKFFDIAENEKSDFAEFIKLLAADTNPVVEHKVWGVRIFNDGTKAVITLKVVRKDGKEDTERVCFVKKNRRWKAILTIFDE